MSTHAGIGILFPSGYVRAIYCHHDGYVSFVGRILQNYYKEDSKVAELLALGNISCLGKYISPRKDLVHTFANPAKDVTVAYHRDRGEDLVKPYQFENIKEYETDAGFDYLYLFDGTNWWVHTKEHEGFYRYTTTKVFYNMPMETT